MVNRWVREPELSARLVRPFLRLLRERGLAIDAPIIRGSTLDDPDSRIPHRIAIAMLNQVALGTGDEAIGLHAAECVQPGDFDVLEYAAMSSATMGESVLVINRYLRLIHDAAEFSLDNFGDEAVWSYRFPPGLTLPPSAAEYFMAIFVLLGRRYAGCDFLSRGAAHFTHAAPRDVSAHQRMFGPTVLFGQTQNALVMPLSALSLPMVKSDPALRSMLERVAKEMIGRLPKADALTSQIRPLLTAELGRGDPGIVTLARNLHMTPRTLRRRLREIGTTHRDILEHVRKELAIRYLSERAIGTTEVAFLLGYSNASAFHKAFKRWTGVSASEYRRRHAPKQNLAR
jgi:AraC-like DNA-binding protein